MSDESTVVAVGLGPPEPLRHCENSEVFPATSVAVLVMTGCPVGDANVSGPKLALPLASVVTVAVPMKVCPWP